jgi:hypothetical protein
MVAALVDENLVHASYLIPTISQNQLTAIDIQRDIAYQLRNFFIPKIIIDFRTDLHKMKIINNNQALP